MSQLSTAFLTSRFSSALYTCSRRRRLAWTGVGVLSVALAAGLVHFLVIDLDVAWIRLLRKMTL